MGEGAVVVIRYCERGVANRDDHLTALGVCIGTPEASGFYTVILFKRGHRMGLLLPLFTEGSMRCAPVERGIAPRLCHGAGGRELAPSPRVFWKEEAERF